MAIAPMRSGFHVSVQEYTAIGRGGGHGTEAQSMAGGKTD